MKRLIAILLLLLATTTAFAQEKKERDDDYNTTREFKSKVFEVKQREPRDLYASLRLLGSGFKGAALNYSQDLRTITVRDFPENVASIEEALKRLDQPPAAEPDVEFRITVLIGSKTPLNGSPVPDELAPVVKQLQNTLRYANYGVMTTSVQRTRSGRGLEGSGVADSTILGVKVEDMRPILYTYKLTTVNVGTSGIDIGNFNFSVRLPINVGGGIQYQPVGFDTPVSIKQNEKVVIGTTSMGDKALIVVVTAH